MVYRRISFRRSEQRDS